MVQQIPAVTPDDVGDHQDKGAMLLVDDFRGRVAFSVELTLLGANAQRLMNMRLKKRRAARSLQMSSAAQWSGSSPYPEQDAGVCPAE
jgi:hypothetical protein